MSGLWYVLLYCYFISDQRALDMILGEKLNKNSLSEVVLIAPIITNDLPKRHFSF